MDDNEEVMRKFEESQRKLDAEKLERWLKFLEWRKQKQSCGLETK